MIPFLKTDAHAQAPALAPFSVQTATGRDLDALAALLGWPERCSGEDDATVRARICGDVAPRPQSRRHDGGPCRTPFDEYRDVLAELAEFGIFFS